MCLIVFLGVLVSEFGMFTRSYSHSAFDHNPCPFDCEVIPTQASQECLYHLVLPCLFTHTLDSAPFCSIRMKRGVLQCGGARLMSSKKEMRSCFEILSIEIKLF